MKAKTRKKKKYVVFEVGGERLPKKGEIYDDNGTIRVATSDHGEPQRPMTILKEVTDEVEVID